MIRKWLSECLPSARCIYGTNVPIPRVTSTEVNNTAIIRKPANPEPPNAHRRDRFYGLFFLHHKCNIPLWVWVVEALNINTRDVTTACLHILCG